jgi:hypothetical protein
VDRRQTGAQGRGRAGQVGQFGGWVAGDPMSAKDIYHQAVKNALAKEGWTITHDPYVISVGRRKVYVDIGAERMIAAERGSEKIAVEIKSFQSPSDLHDLENATGQYLFYRFWLGRLDVDRRLYLAVPYNVQLELFEDPIARPFLEDLQIAVVAFDPKEETIKLWHP